MDEALEALDAVVRQGKPRYIGVSNWPAYRAARGLRRSEVKNLTRIDCVQPRYNLLFRAFERVLLPLCDKEGIADNPIAGGWGKLVIDLEWNRKSIFEKLDWLKQVIEDLVEEGKPQHLRATRTSASRRRPPVGSGKAVPETNSDEHG
jgi:hypothetical protein